MKERIAGLYIAELCISKAIEGNLTGALDVEELRNLAMAQRVIAEITKETLEQEFPSIADMDDYKTIVGSIGNTLDRISATVDRVSVATKEASACET